MKAKNVIIVVLSVILVLVVAAAACFGILYYKEKSNKDAYKDIDEEIKKEQSQPETERSLMELEGGTVITLEADVQNVSDEDMESAENILGLRLESLGYTEASIQKSDSEDKVIQVEIPGVEYTGDIGYLLSCVGKLEFADADGTIILDGSDIESAEYVFGPVSDDGNLYHYVEIEFTKSGVEKFASATEYISKRTYDNTNYISIMIDGNLISEPSVEEPITTDVCVISGSFDRESAERLATMIEYGKLPFAFNVLEVSRVSPVENNK